MSTLIANKIRIVKTMKNKTTSKYDVEASVWLDLNHRINNYFRKMQLMR